MFIYIHVCISACVRTYVGIHIGVYCRCAMCIADLPSFQSYSAAPSDVGSPLFWVLFCFGSNWDKCVYTCMCIHICLYICMCIHKVGSPSFLYYCWFGVIGIYVYIYVCVFIYVCVCIYVCTYILCMCVCVTCPASSRILQLLVMAMVLLFKPFVEYFFQPFCYLFFKVMRF